MSYIVVNIISFIPKQNNWYIYRYILIFRFLDGGQKFKKFLVGASISQDQATLNSITNIISMCNFHPQNREVVKNWVQKEGIPIRLNELEMENKYQKHTCRHK